MENDVPFMVMTLLYFTLILGSPESFSFVFPSKLNCNVSEASTACVYWEKPSLEANLTLSSMEM